MSTSDVVGILTHNPVLRDSSTSAVPELHLSGSNMRSRVETPVYKQPGLELGTEWYLQSETSAGLNRLSATPLHWQNLRYLVETPSQLHVAPTQRPEVCQLPSLHVNLTPHFLVSTTSPTRRPDAAPRLTSVFYLFVLSLLFCLHSKVRTQRG